MDKDLNQKVDLDLDALTRESKHVKFRGRVIEIKYPTLQQFLRIGKLGVEMKEQGEIDGNPDKAVEMLDKMNEIVVELAPELKGENLNYDQLYKLLLFLAELAKPESIQELEQRGITPGEIQKKISSDSSESLPDSSTSTQVTT